MCLAKNQTNVSGNLQQGVLFDWLIKATIFSKTNLVPVRWGLRVVKVFEGHLAKQYLKSKVFFTFLFINVRFCCGLCNQICLFNCLQKKIP